MKRHHFLNNKVIVVKKITHALRFVAYFDPINNIFF